MTIVGTSLSGLHPHKIRRAICNQPLAKRKRTRNYQCFARGDLRPDHSTQVSCQEAGSPTWTRQPRSIYLEVLQGGRGQENYLHAIGKASDQAAHAAREVCK